MATLCPFHEDEPLDDERLFTYIHELAEINGINGLVCKGHTGEIMSLRPLERTRVTALVTNAVASSARTVKVVSGVSPSVAWKRSSMRLRRENLAPTQFS